MIYEILMIIGSYLLGSICFGYILGRLVKKIDIREHGTKNPGTSNVFLVIGPWAGVLCAILDIGKGIVAVLIAKSYFTPMIALLSGIAVVIGHIFPFYLRFKGGKGLATTLGVALVIAPIEFIIAMILWLIAMFISKRFFLPMFISLLLIPVYMYFFEREIIYIIGFVIIIVIFLFRFVKSSKTLKDMLSGRDYDNFINKLKHKGKIKY